jgi:hypothetical protein
MAEFPALEDSTTTITGLPLPGLFGRFGLPSSRD